MANAGHCATPSTLYLKDEAKIGVEQYFTNINEYAKNKSIKLEHYIISSGTKEMIF
jgi:hypothetical protein